MLLTLSLLILLYCFRINNKKKSVKRKWSQVELLNVKDDPIVLENKIDCNPINSVKKCRLSSMDCLTCKGLNYRCVHLDKDTPILNENDEIIKTLEKNIYKEEGYCMKGDPIKCNYKLGRLIVAKKSPNDDGYYLICKCKYPGLYDKKTLFGDCVQPIRCEIENLNTIDNPLTQGKCKCPSDSYSVINNFDGPRCLKRKIRNQLSESDFENNSSGYIDVFENKDLFNKQWVNSLPKLKKFKIKHPCQWDSLNGKYLTGGFNKLITIKKNVCCFCDPTYGFFPTYSDYSILHSDSTDGLGRINYPNGCSSIYADSAYKETNVKEEIVFYRSDGGPKTIWKYKPESSKLKNIFKGHEVIIKIHWPLTLMNYRFTILKKNWYIRKNIIECYKYSIPGVWLFFMHYNCSFKEERSVAIQPCQDILSLDEGPKNGYGKLPFPKIRDRDHMVQILRHNAQIVCTIPREKKDAGKEDVLKNVDNFYKDTVVMNPYILKSYFDVNGAKFAWRGWVNKDTDDKVSFLVIYDPQTDKIYFEENSKNFSVNNRASKCKRVPFNLCAS